MILKVLADILFIRSTCEWLSIRDIKAHCPHLEHADILIALEYFCDKGFMRVCDGGGTYRYKSTPEGKVFFAIIRELVVDMVGEHDE